MTQALPKLATLEEIVEEAAEIARRHASRLASTAPDIRIKADKSPVTAADLEIAAFLRERLLGLLPGSGWLCEEGAAVESEKGGLVWVVDPLDGTKEFIRGIPEFSISIALLVGLEPAVGAVANPMTREMGLWSASEGLLLNGFAASTPPQTGTKLEDIVANASRTEFEKGSLVEFCRTLREVKPIGSVAYKLLRVAAGLEQLYFSVEPKSEWDLCGGIALIHAAGLDYVRFDGAPMRFTGTNKRINTGAIAGAGQLIQGFLARFGEAVGQGQDRIARGIVR